MYAIEQFCSNFTTSEYIILYIKFFNFVSNFHYICIKIYTTYNKRKLNIDDIDHQHLSNIYWFTEIIYGIPTHKWVWQKIVLKFNGIILPYKPKSDFKEEISILDKMGCLEWIEIDGARKANIMWKGNKVGEVCSVENNREILIKDILGNVNNI